MSMGIDMTNNIKEMKLKAEGISCSGCVEDMEKILRDTEGILSASVNYAEGLITIRYDAEIIDRKQVFLTARKLVAKLNIISETEV
ncbi:MAG TPA: heavy-metal-associated domain-containing protein [Nitrospirae bacterium]|nr:heavy-metal-associated domain protein [bacterium BMS3Abin06]HDH12272.1 heavy-metal-associated domain-containing protein [Nitrospirota bacterium]HDZ01148.1 heavy-metal-associated domain-containing protein [Nitrospirota bacterium]